MTMTIRTTTALIRAEEELPAFVSWISSTCGSASGVSLSSATLSFDLLDNVEDSGVVEESSVSVAAPFVDMVVTTGVDGASEVVDDVGGDGGGVGL